MTPDSASRKTVDIVEGLLVSVLFSTKTEPTPIIQEMGKEEWRRTNARWQMTNASGGKKGHHRIVLG